MKIQLMLLAAGQSQRFNASKQLADINGQPMLCHCLNQYRQDSTWISGLDSGFIVLGAKANAIRQVIPKEVHVYIAEDWQQGMGHSIAQGMGQLAQDTSHVLLALGDQVAISSGMIAQLLCLSQQYPEQIIAAKYADTLGAPVIFPKAYFDQLKKLTGDKGAKALLQQNQQNMIALELAEAAVDIDTQAELNQYLGSLTK